MKNTIINEIMLKMQAKLNNNQLEELKKTLEYVFFNYEVSENVNEQDNLISNQNFIELFLSAKKIEGCSAKSMKYYRSTIENMLKIVDKNIKNIITDDLRTYLTDYKINNNSSRVTIDNIRRILSSFFAWLEDEDYIIKSPVRRIHKVKTGSCIKETYTDEVLELMRDNCTELRDLAMIDMLSSTGMRVGEMVLLTRLAQLRDTLLPKLMSGEIDVSNVNISTDKSSFSILVNFVLIVIRKMECHY